jgi:hypothetical protein
MIRSLTEAECRYAVRNGEFEPSLIRGRTALILTQSWCPQWKTVKSYLEEAEKKALGGPMPEPSILYIEYDTLASFEEFMAFKEEQFKNREIPYIRYYLDGKCTGQSNYTDLKGFLHRLGW